MSVFPLMPRRHHLPFSSSSSTWQKPAALVPLKVLVESVLLKVPVTPAPGACCAGADQCTIEVLVKPVLLKVLAGLVPVARCDGAAQGAHTASAT